MANGAVLISRLNVQLNRNLFGALALEKLAMFITLGIAIMVAGFCVFGTLTLMVQTGELYPMTPAEIAEEAETVAAFMQSQGDFYDNPLWTLNAFAFSGEGESDRTSSAHGRLRKVSLSVGRRDARIGLLGRR